MSGTGTGEQRIIGVMPTDMKRFTKFGVQPIGHSMESVIEPIRIIVRTLKRKPNIWKN